MICTEVVGFDYHSWAWVTTFSRKGILTVNKLFSSPKFWKPLVLTFSPKLWKNILSTNKENSNNLNQKLASTQERCRTERKWSQAFSLTAGMWFWTHGLWFLCCLETLLCLLSATVPSITSFYLVTQQRSKCHVPFKEWTHAHLLPHCVLLDLM